MISDRERLEMKFRDFSDEELRKRWVAGHLTPAAQRVAADEARVRGLALTPYQATEELKEESTQQPKNVSGEYLGDWVLVARNLSPTEAHILCSFLAAHDIPTTPGDTNLVQTYWLWSQAVGGASVRVPKSLFEQARLLLADRRRGTFALSESFDQDEASAPPEAE